MKAAEYRGMADEQLALSLKETTANLFHLRFQSATERLETPSEISKAKREVARILTIQRERAIKAAAAKKAAMPPPAPPAPKPAPVAAAPKPAAKAPAPAAAAKTSTKSTKAEKPAAKTAKPAKKEK